MLKDSAILTVKIILSSFEIFTGKLENIDFIEQKKVTFFFIIGLAYSNDCPIRPKLPSWLIMLGVFTIAHAVLDDFPQLGRFMFITLLIWFFFGNLMIFPVKSDVQYTDFSLTSTYCNETLYLSSFWLVIAGDIFFASIAIIVFVLHYSVELSIQIVLRLKRICLNVF
jgi:hypothetical protein